MTPKFSPTLQAALHKAIDLARDKRHPEATPEHLLLALVDENDARLVFQACNVDIEKMHAAVYLLLADLPRSENVVHPEPDGTFQRVINRAVVHVQAAGREEVTGANVLVAMFSEQNSRAVYILQEQGMTRLDAVQYVSHGVRKNPSSSGTFRIPPVGLTISLRDWFAGQALAGICGDGIPGSHHRPDDTAREAYAYADAMLEARKSKPPQE